MTSVQQIELLAPARDLPTAIEAIKHGADAVYMGASSHGARHAAANSVQSIKEACSFAHRFGAKIYVTLNTIIFDSEIRMVEKLIHELYEAGVDALIVQDMSLLRMNIPQLRFMQARSATYAHHNVQLFSMMSVSPNWSCPANSR